MKIGVITQWFSPEPAPIPTSLVEHLAENGQHDVRVLTGFPNYPAGRVYPGYRQTWTAMDSHDGSKVIRVPQYTSHDNNGFRRMLSFLSFAFTSLWNAWRLRDRDVIYVYATPMTVCLSALYLRWVHRIPFIMHVQDLWPESVLDSGMIKSPTLRRLTEAILHWVLRCVYKNATEIVAIAPSMATTLQARGASPGAVSVVYNWATNRAKSSSSDVAAFRRRVSSEDRWLFLYAGNIGVMQDVETIVEAAHIVGAEAGIDFAIVGDGASLDSVKEVARNKNVPHLTFIDRIPFDQMGPVYAAADFQFVTLLDRPVFRGTIPSKVGASLAAGLPIITTVSGDLEAMCTDAGFGLVSEPEDATALAATCLAAVKGGRAARNRMAAAAAQYYANNLSAPAGLRALELLLHRAVSKRPATPGLPADEDRMGSQW